MAESVSTVLKLPELKTETFRQTLDQLHSRASSIISLSLQWKDLDGDFASISNAIKEGAKELHFTQESLEQKLDDVKCRESRLDAVHKSLEERERAIAAREKDFEIIQKKENEERNREIEGIEKLRAEIREKEEKLNDFVSEKTREIETKEKQNAEFCDELRLKEERIEEKRKELGFKEEKFKDLELKEKLIQEWAEEVELEKEKYMKLCKEVELKQKQIEDNHGFNVTMDGKALQIYLNEHSGDINSMRIVVSMALAHSLDPSMLVLDALQGFYPPHLKKGDKEFEEEVVRRSHILLLEELMKLSPEIQPPAKKEARRIALDWLKKLKSDAEHSLEVLGFLQLVASYGLASAFNSDKLLSRLEIVANHSQAPALFRALGFAHKISDFIQTLIRKKKLNEAIRFIYAFEMVGVFQPVSLLNDFLRISRIATKQLRKKNKTLEGQINATNKRLADIKYALRCIEECKIDYGPSLKSLEQQVGFLEKEISKRKEAAALGDQIRKLHDEQEKHLAPVAAVDASAGVPTSSASASISVSATTTTTTQPQRLSGIKRPGADVSAGKISKEWHGANQASITISDKEISEGKAAAAGGDKIQKLHDEKEKPPVAAVDVPAVVPATASATSSAIASTSVSASTTTTQSNRLSGNKHPQADVSAGKILKEFHGANQASIKIAEKEISEGKAAAGAAGDKIQKLQDEKEKHLAPAVASVDASGVVPVTASASSSAIASTSVSAITQPQQISGNKRPQADVSAEKNFKESHGANQVTIDVLSKTNLPLESNEASASLDSQPKTNSCSVNPSKEELKKLLDMCEKRQLEDVEIAAALRSAHDPGKLVLDVMNVPVPFKLDGSKDLKVHILKSSFLLLLKQLRAAAPQLNPKIREEAKKFALFWKSILAKKSKKTPFDVICFLQFLASFKLGSSFYANQLLDLLDSDHWCKEAPDICEVLGLADKIPSFIQNRIKKEQHLEAVKYIYALNMVDKFPPASVLKDYLSNSSKKSGKRPIDVQIVDIDKEIKSLEDVIKCITDYKITGLSPEKLKERIAQLEKEKQHTIQASKLKTRQVSPASAPRTSSSGSNARLQQKHRNKGRRTHISSDYRLKPYNGAESAMHRHPLQHPPVSYMSRGVPSPPRHHVWPAYPPRDIGFNNYGTATVTPAYHWDALGDFGHNMPFHY